MTDSTASTTAGLSPHGSPELPSVTLDTYNAELRDPHSGDGGGFIGDRASKRAFQAILDDWRERMRKVGDDPLGEVPTAEISKKTLDHLLVDGDPEAAGLVQGAIEEFAQELAGVIRRFMRLKGWRETQRIVVGGGLRASRVGELAIGRAGVLLKTEAAMDVTLQPIRHHPDEAGLIGAAHLLPSWMFKGHDCILAVDIGGTNMRAGVVELNLKKASDLSEAHVMDLEHWRHRDDKPTREQAIDRLGEMLQDLVKPSGEEGAQAGAVRGVGLPGDHRGGRDDQARGAEPAGELGGQQVQPAGTGADDSSRDRRRGDDGDHAQRCGGAGAERDPVSDRCGAVGGAHDRDGAWECAVYQPQWVSDGEVTALGGF